MSDHVSTIEEDDDGWYIIRCSCGFGFGPVPGAETAADVWGDHKVEAYTADLSARLAVAEAAERMIQRSGLRVAWCMYCGLPCLAQKRSLCCGEATTNTDPSEPVPDTGTEP